MVFICYYYNMTTKAEITPTTPESADVALDPKKMATTEEAAAHDHSPWYLNRITWPVFFAITTAIALYKWFDKPVEVIEKAAAAGHVSAPKAEKGHGGGDHGGGGHH